MTGPIRLLDLRPEISFHAEASLFWLPYCNEETAVDQIAPKKEQDALVRAPPSSTLMSFARTSGVPLSASIFPENANVD